MSEDTKSIFFVFVCCFVLNFKFKFYRFDICFKLKFVALILFYCELI